jgi:flagellar motor protein MotB
MRRFAWTRLIIVMALAFPAGCAENSMVLKGQTTKLQEERLAMSQRYDDLQKRALSLDRDNQDLAMKLAQSGQRTKAMEEQVALLRDQLSSTNGQLARLDEEKRGTDQKVQAMNASMRRQGGITITPNNSLAQTLPAIDLPDVHVRRDGDLVRVELPSGRLFEPGNARLASGANQTIATAAAEVLRVYPNQLIGVEGHTDPDPIVNSQWRNHHQLSVGRAMAVYDVLVSQARVPAEQVFLVGYGATRPIFSNATASGKQRNNRIELVVYPETPESRQ